MGITKDQLFFDPANPTDGDTGSNYVRGADGTVIGNTGDSLKVTGNFNVDGSTVALDAPTLAALENITATIDNAELEITNDVGNPIPVNGTVALDAPTLAALEDVNATVSGTVELGATTLAALESVTVTATDLDIRNLAFATDTVDASGSVVALDAATLAALESVTVSATDFDIRDLTHVSDSVRIGDGTDFLTVNSDGSINVADQIANSIKNSAFTATTTATAIVGTALTGRRLITIQNLGNKDVAIGDGAVTFSTGIIVPAGSSAEFPWGESISPFAVTQSSTASLRILETSYI